MALIFWLTASFISKNRWVLRERYRSWSQVLITCIVCVCVFRDDWFLTWRHYKNTEFIIWSSSIHIDRRRLCSSLPNPQKKGWISSYLCWAFVLYFLSHLEHLQGANFRDLPGVVVGSDNVVRRDPEKEQELLPSGKPLVSALLYSP